MNLSLRKRLPYENQIKLMWMNIWKITFY